MLAHPHGAKEGAEDPRAAHGWEERPPSTCLPPSCPQLQSLGKQSHGLQALLQTVCTRAHHQDGMQGWPEGPEACPQAGSEGRTGGEESEAAFKLQMEVLKKGREHPGVAYSLSFSDFTKTF